MAPVYADQPFKLIPTPIFLAGKDAKPDVYDDAASEMAIVHNLAIRGLNSIYLQAPHVEAKDTTAFCQYIRNFCLFLDIHHTGEETDFFPYIEKATGDKSLMAANINQHHAFHDGLGSLNTYARAVIDGKQAFDGAKVVATIDGFGALLVEHLSDEIPTLIALRKHHEKLTGLKEAFAHEAEKNMKLLGLTEGMPWAWSNLDMHFENDLWHAFPPAPWFIKFLIMHVTWWVHSDWWKFGSCDRFGNMKPLYAVGSATE